MGSLSLCSRTKAVSDRGDVYAPSASRTNDLDFYHSAM
uniref:Uncharacterized protein n=1 Tax=Anguilla anguilla TaxID=7936 RepID=A0A0E9VH63_ANGAN